MINIPWTRNRGPRVVVVAPAVSIRTPPRVFASERGAPAQPLVGSSPDAKAGSSQEIARTYRVIESRTAAVTGNGTYKSWRDRRWAVLQFTVEVPDTRPQVLLARVQTASLRFADLQPTHSSIMECARAAGLALDADHVAAGLHHLSMSITDRRP